MVGVRQVGWEVFVFGMERICGIRCLEVQLCRWFTVLAIYVYPWLDSCLVGSVGRLAILRREWARYLKKSGRFHSVVLGIYHSLYDKLPQTDNQNLVGINLMRLLVITCSLQTLWSERQGWTWYPALHMFFLSARQSVMLISWMDSQIPSPGF